MGADGCDWREPGADFRSVVLASGSTTSIPIDWASLQRAELVRVLTIDEARELLVANAQQGAAVDQGWSAGLITFEVWAELRRFPVGAAGLAVRRREVAVVPPIPQIESPPWKGSRVYIGALGVEILVALGLHEAFGGAVQQVVLLEDAYERFAEGGLDSYPAVLQNEQVNTDAWWLPVDGLPIVERDAMVAERLTEEDLPAVVSWLASKGLAPRSGAPPWAPPAGTVVLDALVALGLHRRGLTDAFLETCRRQGVVVGMARESVDGRVARRREIAVRVEASGLAEAAWRWLTDLRNRGKLEVRAVPSGPPLPPLNVGSADPDWVARSFATRELLRADPELLVVGCELVELGVNGKGPLGLLVERAWTPEALAEHEGRYNGVSAKQVTIAQLCRELAPPERRSDAVGGMAIAGYPDAFGGSDLLALYDTYGGLSGEEPRNRVLGTVAYLARDHRPVHASLLATYAVLPLMDAILMAWDERRQDSEACTVAMLDALVAMDDGTRGRYRLLELALSFLAGQSAHRPGWFFLPVAPGQVQLDPNSRGVGLWKVVGAWAGRAGRWAAVHLAVAQAIKQEDRKLGGAAAMYGAILGPIPAPTEYPQVVNLAGPSIASLLNKRADYAIVLDMLTVGPRTLRQWLESALAGLDAPKVDGTDVVVEADDSLIRLALEGALPEVLPHAEDISDLLWFDDGGVAQALSLWAERQDEAALLALRATLDASPLRAVRQDPSVMFAWSPYADPGTLGPRSVTELKRLLSEPDDWDRERSLVARIEARLAEGGDWDGRLVVEVARQLSRIPGGLVAMAQPEMTEEMLRKMVRLPEEHRRYPTGELVASLRCLGREGRKEPQRRFGDVEVRLPELVARAAAAALAPYDETGDYAACESGLLRVCASVVDALSTVVLDPAHRVWLCWRLFGWLTEQLLQSNDPDKTARTLASLAPSLVARTPDPYDPSRAGVGRIDTRELSVLQVLSLLGSTRPIERGDNTPEGAVDWHVLQPTLLRIASRELTQDERELRDGWTSSSLGGPALLAPDLARLLVLRLDLDAVSFLDATRRMAWLDDALSRRPADHPLLRVAEQVLVAFAMRAKWSEAEALRIHEAVVEPTFEAVHAGLSLLLIAAAGFWPENSSMADKAASVAIANATNGTVGLLHVQEWFVAAARAGTLRDAVGRVRAEVARVGLNELPYLARLARPLLDSATRARDQAVAVVAELATEPSLAETEVIRSLTAVPNDRGEE